MEITEKVSDFAQEAGDKIASATSQAAEALGEKGEQLKNAEQCMIKSCSTYIRDNPLTSLGIAVVSGFLLSRVLGKH